MRKYAIVNNNVVTSIIEIEEELYSEYASKNQMVIDITESPQTVSGFVLNGNKLEVPQGFSDREMYEIYLAELKTEFGIKLCRNAINRIGARNKILNKTGIQVVTLLNALIAIKLLLETGALGTARYNCSLLLNVYTEYTDIFQYVINEINVFEQNNSL
jgi:hypothetical protein